MTTVQVEGCGDAAIDSTFVRRFHSALLVAAFLGALPAIFLGALVRRFAVDVPYYDEWKFIEILRRVRTGEFVVSDLFAQHEVHRIVFPRAILISLAQITGWDTRYEDAVNFGLACVLLVVLSIAIADVAWRLRSAVFLSLIPLAALMVCSPSQFENWLWGWQNEIFLSGVGVTGALFLLCVSPQSPWRVAAAVLLGLIASFSFANGLLVWPLGVVPIVLLSARKSAKFKIIVSAWVVMSVGVFTGYFWRFKFPEHPEIVAPSGSTNVFKYFLAFLGGPFASMSVDRAIAVGAIGIGLAISVGIYAVIARRFGLQRLLPGLLLVLFGLASGALIAVGRREFGVEQALASRYITISNLFWIGLAMTAGALLLEKYNASSGSRWRAAVALVVVIALGAMTVQVNRQGFDSMRQFSHLQRVLRYNLLMGDRSPQMEMLYPDVKWLHWYKEVARKHKLWAWRPNAPPEMFEPPPASYTDL